mgnify:CR=1 FL=1
MYSLLSSLTPNSLRKVSPTKVSTKTKTIKQTKRYKNRPQFRIRKMVSPKSKKFEIVMLIL